MIWGFPALSFSKTQSPCLSVATRVMWWGSRCSLDFGLSRGILLGLSSRLLSGARSCVGWGTRLYRASSPGHWTVWAGDQLGQSCLGRAGAGADQVWAAGPAFGLESAQPGEMAAFGKSQRQKNIETLNVFTFTLKQFPKTNFVTLKTQSMLKRAQF